MSQCAIIAYLLLHRTRHYVVTGSYYDRMRFQCAFCCNTGLDTKSLRECIVNECAMIAYLLYHRTGHYVVTGLYHGRMRFQCVPVATVGHTSASAVLWAVSLAAGKVVTTCPEETAVCFWLAVRGSVCWRRIGIRIKLTLWANALSLRILLRHNTQHYVVKWLYYKRMRYHSVCTVTQDSTLRRYAIV